MNRKLKLQELNRIDISEFKSASKLPLVIVLDNIRSLNNVGSVFRTSDAFRIEKILLCGITAKPPHRDIQKTALGATETVEWEYYENTIDCIQKLKQEGYEIASIEQAENTTFLHEYQPKNKVAIVMGNEVKGVEQQVIDASDVCVEIPQFGTKHSLNISVCTGVVVWDLFNKLSFKTK